MSEDPFFPHAIYFDTNPFLGAGWPNPSAQLLQLMDYGDRLDLPLCLPEVVVQELEGHWIRELVDDWRKINSGIDRLNKGGLSVVRFENLPTLPSHDELRTKLRNQVGDFTERFSIVPMTARPLSHFLNLAIDRGATFEDGGRGFQDAIVLCSVLDDMKTKQIPAAVLVTHDKAFRNDAAVQFTICAGVRLKIVPTLDDLEKVLLNYLSSMVRDHYEREAAQVSQALNPRLQDLEAYLVDHLTVTPSELRVGGTVKKIESLHVESIESVHTAHGLGSDETATDPNKIKVSVTVKIQLVLDVERYFSPAQPTLKVGGAVVYPESIQALIPTYSEIQGKVHDAVAVVEADAGKSDAGLIEIHFTRAYLKSNDYDPSRGFEQPAPKTEMISQPTNASSK